jgi:uncharacterized protein YoxC
MYQRAMNHDLMINTDVLPFSEVDNDSIVKARQLLFKIADIIKEDIEVRKDGINTDFEKITDLKEKMCEVSSRYFYLIPSKFYKN